MSNYEVCGVVNLQDHRPTVGQRETWAQCGCNQCASQSILLASDALRIRIRWKKRMVEHSVQHQADANVHF